jgi:hypothetical protein
MGTKPIQDGGKAPDLARAVDWAMETNATLAVVLLDAGKTDQALATAEPLLPKLTSSALQGARKPFCARWNCYRVLATAGDARAASLLATAAADLRGEAERIDNDVLRRSFLERIPAHAAILSARQYSKMSVLFNGIVV